MRLETSGGASLRLHAVETLASGAAVERLREQVYDVLTRRLPVAVTVEQLGAAGEASSVFGQVCAVLKAAVDEARDQPANVSIAIDATALAPQQLWLKRCEVLGAGPVYLLLGSKLTPPSVDAELRRQQDRFWLQCWHLRNNGYVRTALAPMISSPCALLPSEAAFGILPPSGLQVPPGTAWIPMQLNLTQFANAMGKIDTIALRDHLQRCIDFGEAKHDEVVWPTAAMRHDAWLNRRLAISVTGIGDLAVLRGLDPGCFLALKELGKVLQDIREIVNSYSRQLALQTEPAPSLDSFDRMRCADWQARWRSALEFAAMRHRNLLAISPWSVFPSAQSADSRYADLLPLLEYADACSFPPPPCLQHWNINEFKHFHHRAWAVLECRDARKLFAEQI
jgi:hypothetical protein